MSGTVFDSRPCELGEGPLWHPTRNQLFWFDILGKRLLSEGGRVWQFDEHVSAAGWLDTDRLLIASETALFQFDLNSGAQTHVVDLEADNPTTRSNDGRADPFGGFWIGTMGKSAAQDAGAIYRFYRGELRQLYAKITISNSICFSPDKSWAYFTDTIARKLMRVALEPVHGWPEGAPEVLLDCTGENFGLDGSVTAADGSILNAQWGAGRVARYSPQGTLLDSYDMPAAQTTCPAFGGPGLETLFVTSALEGLSKEQLAKQPKAGMTFQVIPGLKGLAEPQVIL